MNRRAEAIAYCSLLEGAARAMRNEDSRVFILGPGTGFDWEFLEQTFAQGALKQLDAVSIQPVHAADLAPEAGVADFKKLRQLVESCESRSGKRRVALVGEETGPATSAGGISGRLQADYFVRQQLVNLWQGMPLTLGGNWREAGDREAGYGLVRPNLAPKMAYVGAQILNRELEGYRILRRMETGEADYVLMCVNPEGGFKLAAWTTGAPHLITVELPYGAVASVTGVTAYGRTFKLQNENRKLKLELGGTVQYVNIH